MAGIPLVASHGASDVPPVFERGLAPVPATMPLPALEWLPAWVRRKIANAMPTRLTDPTVFLNIVAAELGVAPVPTLAARHGMALAPRHADTPRLTGAVKRVVSDLRCTASATRVKGRYAGVDGAGRVADAIGRYLALRAVNPGAAPAA